MKKTYLLEQITPQDKNTTHSLPPLSRNLQEILLRFEKLSYFQNQEVIR